MTKFSNRVNKLFLKTHYFISKNEIRLMCDYYKAQLDEANVKSEDFSEEIKEIERLVSDKSLSKTERLQKFQALAKNQIVITAWRYELNRKRVENHSQGIFVFKKTGETILSILKEARNYFQKIGS